MEQQHGGALQSRLEARVAVLEASFEKLDHMLWGNGQPGAIEMIRRDIKESREESTVAVDAARKEVAAIRKQIIYAALVLATAVICAGTGPLTLKTLLDILAHAIKP